MLVFAGVGEVVTTPPFLVFSGFNGYDVVLVIELQLMHEEDAAQGFLQGYLVEGSSDRFPLQFAPVIADVDLIVGFDLLQGSA